MNYYSLDLNGPRKDYWTNATNCLESLSCCCAVAEVCVSSLGTRYSTEKLVGVAIHDAVYKRYSILIWNIPQTGYKGKMGLRYEEVTEMLSYLPGTKLVAEYKNKNSGNILRTYITDLQKEWK